MAAEHAGSTSEIPTVLLGAFSNPASLNALIDGGKEGMRVILSLIASIYGDPEKQQDLLIGLFLVLSREGGMEETNQRDAALFIIKNPLLKKLILEHSDFVYSAFCSAIERQTNRNDAYDGSVAALLDAGKSIAPYLRITTQQKKGLRAIGDNLVQKFTSSFDTRTHLQAQLEQMRERVSPDPELDLIIEDILNGSKQHMSTVQIAKKLGREHDTVRRSMLRVVAQGRIREQSTRSEDEKEKWEKLKCEVKRLKKNNIRDEVITMLLDMRYEDVTSAISELIAEGELEKSPRNI